MEPNQRKFLDYASRDATDAGNKKQTMDLFREPPGIAHWTTSDFIAWLIAFALALVGVVAWVASRLPE